MENNLNSKLLTEKGVKKLDLININTRQNNKLENILINDQNTNNLASGNVNYNNEKVRNTTTLFLENLILSDYEKYQEFLSFEDSFAGKMVNLQNPYYFVPLNFQTKNNEDERLKKYNIQKESFSNKYANKFTKNTSSSPMLNKTLIQSNSYKIDKNKYKK